MVNLGTWRGLAKVVVSDALGSRRYALSTEPITDVGAISGNRATWTGAPGSALTLYMKWDVSSAPGFLAQTSIRVEARLPNGASLSTWSVPNGGNASGDESQTFHFDSNALDGIAGSARAGMVELYVFVEKNAAPTWSADSRGALAGIAGGTNDWAQGYVRAPVGFSAYVISNIALGGATPATFAARDPLHTRLTFAQTLFLGGGSEYPVTLQHKQGATTVRSQNDNPPNNTSSVYEWSWSAATSAVGGTGRVNKDFLVSASLVDVVVSLPATTFGGDSLFDWDAATLPAGWAKTSANIITLSGAHTVDPRITFTHLLQHNDSAFGTPPPSKNVGNGRRLTTDLSFIASRATDARSDGISNGALAWTEKLWDANSLSGSEASPVKSRASTSATQGGEAGWSDALLTWDNALPGGNWTQKEVITTADLLGLEVSNTRTLSLLAFDNEIINVMLEGDLSTPLDHWFSGKPLAIGVAAVKRGIKQIIDSARVWIIRPKIGANGDVTAEYLTSDRMTWATGDPGETHVHVLTQSVDDPKIFRINFTSAETATWSSRYDIAIACEVIISGTPYSIKGTLAVVGKKNHHSKYAVDAPGMVGFPSR